MTEPARKPSGILITVVAIITLAVGAGLVWGTIRFATALVEAFKDLDTTVAVSLVTASGTVIAATTAVVVGRYFESKRERDALHRDRKIEVYDAFLRKIIEMFATDDDQNAAASRGSQDELIAFMRESQRQLILWSGPKVIRSYAAWIRVLRSGEPTADAVLKMEDFFLAVRHDLGHQNRGIQRGDIAGFIVRHIDIFLAEIQKNPNITLARLAEIEKQRIGSGENAAAQGVELKK